MSNSFKSSVRRFVYGLHPYSHLSPVGSRNTLFDMMMLDKAYKIMNRSHDAVHRSLIKRIGEKGYDQVLEVACGTGWNVPTFRAEGLKYTGLDISDTAIALAAQKFPENNYLNLPVAECGVLKDSSFDVVYNSAMLEHIGYCKEAMLELIRLAKYEAYFVFFDGLTDADDHHIEFFPWADKEISGEQKNIYGRKLILQNHIERPDKGWYLNRYSRKKIAQWMGETPYEVEFLDSGNSSFITIETVVVVRKSAK